MNYILARLQEASTWRGIVLFITGVGISIEPALMEQIIAVGIAIAGLLGFVTADKKAE